MWKRQVKYKLFQLDEITRVGKHFYGLLGQSEESHDLYLYEEFDSQQEAIDFLLNEKGSDYRRLPDNIVVLPVVKTYYE